MKPQNQTDTDHLSELPDVLYTKVLLVRALEGLYSTQYVYDICKYPKKVLSKSDICFHMILVQGKKKCIKLKSMSPF